MLRAGKAGLRARDEADVAVLHAELYDDIVTHMQADPRPWRPIPAGSSASPYAISEPRDDVAGFSAVELTSGELAGEAVLWDIDLHNRTAHLGLSLRPAFRGRGLGSDVVLALCQYGFAVRGQRLGARRNHAGPSVTRDIAVASCRGSSASACRTRYSDSARVWPDRRYRCKSTMTGTTA